MGQATTVIAAGAIVSGRIEGSEDLDVLGAVDGAIALDGHINVAESARLDADVEANVIHISGVVVGNITARESIHLAASCMVAGDVSAPSVILEDGARYRGYIDMGNAGAKKTTPPPPAATPASTASTVTADEADSDDDEADAPARKKVRIKKRS